MTERAKIAPTVKEANAVRRVGKNFINLVTSNFQRVAAFWVNFMLLLTSLSFLLASSGSLSLELGDRLRAVMLLVLVLVRVCIRVCMPKFLGNDWVLLSVCIGVDVGIVIGIGIRLRDPNRDEESVGLTLLGLTYAKEGWDAYASMVTSVTAAKRMDERPECVIVPMKTKTGKKISLARNCANRI